MSKQKKIFDAIGFFLSGLLILFFQSCSTRNLVVDEFTGIVETGMHAIEHDDDLEMLEKAFPANIKLLETMLANDPDNRRIHLLLARLYGAYGFAFKEHQLEKALHSKRNPTNVAPPRNRTETSVLKNRLSGYYSKGIEYALDALERSYPGSRTQLADVKTRDAFIDSLTREDVPALFWYGFNMGAYINRNRDSVRAVSKAGLVEKVMQKVIALDDAYFYHTAHLVLLAYYHDFPPFTGGNQKLSRFHYDALKKKAGKDFLLADLYYARYILYKEQDRKRFAEVLTGVIEFSDKKNRYPLLNQIARVRAEIYLYSIDDLFD